MPDDHVQGFGARDGNVEPARIVQESNFRIDSLQRLWRSHHGAQKDDSFLLTLIVIHRPDAYSAQSSSTQTVTNQHHLASVGGHDAHVLLGERSALE